MKSRRSLRIISFAAAAVIAAGAMCALPAGEMPGTGAGISVSAAA